jgi:hypothetical protein
LRGVTGEGSLADLRETIRQEVPRLKEDRRMDLDWAAVLEMLRDHRLMAHFPEAAAEAAPVGGASRG